MGAQRAASRPSTVRRAPLSSIQHESGHAFTARTYHPELSGHTGPSAARVLEDGQPLPGPANALHEAIRTQGAGRYSFWYDFVYFSTPDGTDPRTNGRQYEIEYSVTRLQAALLGARESLGLTRPPRAARAAYGADLQLRMWQRIGFTPAPESPLLDFGCGGGERVDDFRRRGYSAFGCDIALPSRPVGPLQAYIEQGVIRPIGLDPYRIPFDDHSFDVVFSITVFEHVMDYDSALAEIRRVLRPAGTAIHLFPAPWKPIETHAFVPFASRIQWYWWLYLWALLGIRNEYQNGYSAKQTADVNYHFLKHQTNYLPKHEIRAHVLRHFDECRFVEEAAFPGRRYDFFLKHPRLLSAYRNWFSETTGRVLVCARPKP